MHEEDESENQEPQREDGPTKGASGKDDDNGTVDRTHVVEIETDEVDQATGRRTVRSSKSVSRTVRSSESSTRRSGRSRGAGDATAGQRERGDRRRGDSERGEHRRSRGSSDRDRRRDERRKRRVDWDDPIELERYQRDLEQRVADLTAEIFHIRDRLNQLR